MPGDPRRVLMTADTVGGVWTYALDLARGLAAAGIHVVLATMGPSPGAAQRDAAHSLDNLELVVSEFRLEWMDDPWNDVHRAGEWLLDLEARLAPDVVHVNGYAHGALPFRAPVVVVGHSCVLSWADAIPGAIDPHKLATYREHVLPGLRSAAVVVAPSRAMLAALQQHYGPLESAVVVHNGRRHDLFRRGRKEPFVFTAGRLWDRAKNVETLSRVAARLPWPTAVAGADTLDEHGARVVTPGIRPLGALDEQAMAQWLGRASIFALPARYEPFGLSALEAALSGCALVLGDIPSQREVWGDAAEFVAPEDGERLASTLGTLIHSPRALGERADAAYARAARYSIEAMTTGYLQAYRTAMERRTTEGATPCVL